MRNGSVCAVGIVALGIIRIELVLFRRDSRRAGCDEEVGNSLGF